MWSCPKCGEEFLNQNEPHECIMPDSPIMLYIFQQPEQAHPHLLEMYEILKAALPKRPHH